MKNFISRLLVTSILLLSSINTVIAQDNKTVLVPLPSVDDFTKGENGWTFGLGLGVEYE